MSKTPRTTRNGMILFARKKDTNKLGTPNKTTK